MSTLDISKTLMYDDSWYNYIKPKNQEKAKLCFMDTDSFIIYIKSEDFYEDIQSDKSDYDEDDKKPLAIGKNKKVIGLFKDESGGKIIKEFAGPRTKIYTCLIDGNTENKKTKWKKICIIKRELMFKNYKDCLLDNAYYTKIATKIKKWLS